MIKHFKYDRDTLYSEVWKQPVTQVARKYGVSNAAIYRACKTLTIPIPPRGYRAKLQSGHPEKVTPLPEIKTQKEKKKRKSENEEVVPEKSTSTNTPEVKGGICGLTKLEENKLIQDYQILHIADAERLISSKLTVGEYSYDKKTIQTCICDIFKTLYAQRHGVKMASTTRRAIEEDILHERLFEHIFLDYGLVGEFADVSTFMRLKENFPEIDIYEEAVLEKLQIVLIESCRGGFEGFWQFVELFRSEYFLDHIRIDIIIDILSQMTYGFFFNKNKFRLWITDNDDKNSMINLAEAVAYLYIWERCREYVMYAPNSIYKDASSIADEAYRLIVDSQNSDGSWSRFADGEPDIDTSIFAIFAIYIHNKNGNRAKTALETAHEYLTKYEREIEAEKDQFIQLRALLQDARNVCEGNEARSSTCVRSHSCVAPDEKEEINNVNRNMRAFWKENGTSITRRYNDLLVDPDAIVLPKQMLNEKLSLCKTVILTANSIEGIIVTRCLMELGEQQKLERIIEDKHIYQFSTIDGAQVVHIWPQKTSSFTLHGSFKALGAAFKRFTPDRVFAVGVCFGADAGFQRLGDVIISKQLVFYDSFNKRTDGKLTLSSDEVQYVGEGILESCPILNETSSNEKVGNFRWYLGSMLTGGTVLSDAQEKRRLLDAACSIGQKIIGGEMEGSGIYFACNGIYPNIPFLIVKGICDWAVNKNGWDFVDATKNGQTSIKNSVQAYACENAFQMARFILSKITPTKLESGI